MDNTQIKMVLEKLLNSSVQVYSIHHLGGGEINHSYKANSDKGAFFIKFHDSKLFPRYFEKEFRGLKELKESGKVDIVEPIGTIEMGGKAYLVLEYLDAAPMVTNYWQLLGESLAGLHRTTNRYFGYVEDNYLGQAIQINHRMSNWGQFYIKNRLWPQVRLVAEKNLISEEETKLFESFFKLVEFAFPEEEPSLLHGDLWKEHVLVNGEGKPCLINPAIYFGHREMDLAMTQMVGSFPDTFYESYHAHYPLESGWKDRMDFCKMYYHLVHLNIYGIAYLPAVQQLLQKWVNV